MWTKSILISSEIKLDDMTNLNHLVMFACFIVNFFTIRHVTMRGAEKLEHVPDLIRHGDNLRAVQENTKT